MPLYCRRNSSVDRSALSMYQPTKMNIKLSNAALTQIQEERRNSYKVNICEQ